MYSILCSKLDPITFPLLYCCLILLFLVDFCSCCFFVVIFGFCCVVLLFLFVVVNFVLVVGWKNALIFCCCLFSLFSTCCGMNFAGIIVLFQSFLFASTTLLLSCCSPGISDNKSVIAVVYFLGESKILSKYYSTKYVSACLKDSFYYALCFYWRHQLGSSIYNCL